MPVPPQAVWDALADAGGYGYWVVGSKVIRDAEPVWPAPGSKFHHTVGVGPVSSQRSHGVARGRPAAGADACGRRRARSGPRGDDEDDAPRMAARSCASRRTRTGLTRPARVQPARAGAHDGRNAESLMRLEELALGSPPPRRGGMSVANQPRVGLARTGPRARSFPTSTEDVRGGRSRARRRHRRASRPRCCWRRRARGVVLVEADHVARGVTGNTTAKVSSQHGLIYARLRFELRCRGRAHLRRRPTRRRWPGSRARRRSDGIDCDFRRRPAYAYVTRPRSLAGRARGRGGERGRAAGHAGRDDAAALPRRGRGALRRPGRVPRAQVPARAGDALADAGGRIYEGSRAVEVDTDERTARSRRPAGASTPTRWCVATHFPFLDRSLAFARVHTQRSYALACRIAATHPRACTSAATRRPVRCAPCRSTGRNCCSSAARGTDRHRRGHRGALRGAGGSSRASTGRELGRVPLVGAGQPDDRHVPYVGPLTPPARGC